ncbi:4-phosphoerythronate dehydrogenase PdxB [Phytohalomonas tamaricis]|uniref:4-phosphoerythronate dehydrogenase PdxB n=1 Tax=Phytohalomonas tamaricis TaxID=2081032 RepID=UPI000D0AD79A|nr:4-phosphoerythronate dehydrogenase PdxB [Phytohalomonas tamaricis]
MRILADKNIPLAEEFFGNYGEIVRVPGREINAAHVRDVDIVLARSITRVDQALLEGSKVRFVGTATIGTDHVDVDWLRANNIGFANAPGCNADSVVDYVLSSLLLLTEEEGCRLRDKTVGIVGAGNVGKRLHERLIDLDINCLICDPPRAEAEGRKDFLSLDALIERADVICMHTPLIRQGEHATYHLLDRERIQTLRAGQILISAGRGACVDNTALRERLERKHDLRVVLDVWENEPAIDQALYALVDIATPHIAGYSLDGKMRGTEMVYQAVCRHFGLPIRCKLGQLKPEPWLRRLVLSGWAPPLEALSTCVRACYDVRRDVLGFDRYQRRLGMAQGFDAYRAEYPTRREFSTLRLELKRNAGELRETLESFGFNIKLANK